MTIEVLKAELVNACRILFAPQDPINPDFFNKLDLAALKLAYRKKAFETHPDRSRMLGISESEMSTRFKQVTSAYELLSPLIIKNVKIIPPDPLPKSTYTRSSGQDKSNPASFTKMNVKSPINNLNDRFYSGDLPNHELLIGQFLYYSGKISWKMLINAIVWQRKQRPLFGEIANQWGILSQQDIKSIIEQRQFREKIGQFAVRTGLITPFQHMAIMGKQRRLQIPFGKYFTDRHIISIYEMNRLIQQMKMHNKILKK